jgi:hypothetical protein
MRYLFLLYGDEVAEQALGRADRQRIVAEHERFSRRLREAGRYVAGAGLDGSSTATLVRRVPDGTDMISDGPFAESKEQLGGLYVLECADLDEALRIAEEVPYSPGLAVEIRPAPY